MSSRLSIDLLSVRNHNNEANYNPAAHLIENFKNMQFIFKLRHGVDSDIHGVDNSVTELTCRLISQL
jgi:hypothetical protein